MKAFLLVTMFSTQIFADSNQPTYNVPAPIELQHVSTNPISRITISDEEINYDLPKQLVGPNARPIILKRVKTPTAMKVFRGPEGEASCHKAENLTCFVYYFDILEYRESAKKFLEENYFGQELTDRLNLMNHFMGEEIGIVRFPHAS